MKRLTKKVGAEIVDLIEAHRMYERGMNKASSDNDWHRWALCRLSRFEVTIELNDEYNIELYDYEYAVDQLEEARHLWEEEKRIKREAA
jgi:isopentenyldiphosphate isomerase